MRFEWDPDKNRKNSKKHGISFDEASRLFTSGSDYLDIYDETHSDDEDRFIAVGQTERGVIVVAYTERPDNVVRIFSARMATPQERKHFEDYWTRMS